MSQQSNQLSQEHRLLRFINPTCSGRRTLVRGLEISTLPFGASITPGSLQMEFYERRLYWWGRFWTFGACRWILFHSHGSSHKGGSLDEVKRMMKGDVCIGRGSGQRGFGRTLEVQILQHIQGGGSRQNQSDPGPQRLCAAREERLRQRIDAPV